MDDLQSKLVAGSQGEIALLDILHFLISAQKTILITMLVGLVAAIAYLAITPKKYEAIAQISMAQVGVATIDSVNRLGMNIEEPSLLVMRLSQPTSFTPELLTGCGKSEGLNSATALAQSIKVVPTKAVSNVVEVKTFAASPKDAHSCAEAIFRLVKTTQAQLVSPYIEAAKAKLYNDEERLANAQSLVSKADKSGVAIGSVYLSTRDEIRFLLDEITALKNVVMTNEARATRLIAPIYVNNTPIEPKKTRVLAGGLLGGLFFGLLIALAFQVVAKLKNEMGKTCK